MSLFPDDISFEDFDNFDEFDGFETQTKYNTLDICGLVKKMEAKKRRTFKISREVNQLSALIEEGPKPNECFKMISVSGGFSSLAIIKYIAKTEVIEEMYVSTFRIGKSHYNVLKQLNNAGRLKQANFLTSAMQKVADTGSDYDYFNYIEKDCQKRGWRIKSSNNHSKLILLRTNQNYYVVETSSNLNENPKMEQFSWENDESLYRWYEELFIELFKCE